MERRADDRRVEAQPLSFSKCSGTPALPVIGEDAETKEQGLVSSRRLLLLLTLVSSFLPGFHSLNLCKLSQLHFITSVDLTHAQAPLRTPRSPSGVKPRRDTCSHDSLLRGTHLAAKQTRTVATTKTVCERKGCDQLGTTAATDCDQQLLSSFGKSLHPSLPSVIGHHSIPTSVIRQGPIRPTIRASSAAPDRSWHALETSS